MFGKGADVTEHEWAEPGPVADRPMIDDLEGFVEARAAAEGWTGDDWSMARFIIEGLEGKATELQLVDLEQLVAKEGR